MTERQRTAHLLLKADKELEKLAKDAIEAFNALSPKEQRNMRRAQKLSWVYGEHCLAHDPPLWTREEFEAWAVRKGLVPPEET